MYSIAAYGEMIADRVRMDAYAEALRRDVRPGSVVLDIGTGTGVMALLACQCGARRVYAVDPSEAVELARETAAANGFADRVVVLQGRSSDVALPERADVIVSDMRGILPPFQHHLPSIVDARERLLAPGGRLVPRSDALWAALLEAPAAHERLVRPWVDGAHGLDLQAGLRHVVNTWTKIRAEPGQLLSEPSRWASLDYATVSAANVRGGGQWRVVRDGTAHGLVLWFDAVLAEGVGFSNAPGAPELIYGQAFFPWPEAVPVREGDRVEFELRADLVGPDYVWTWESAFRRREDAAQAEPALRFRQSTFQGAALSRESLAKRSPAHVPGLGADGEIARTVLGRMADGAAIGDIAAELAREHPRRFPSAQEALDFACDLSARYGR